MSPEGVFIEKKGISRREFLKNSGTVAGTVAVKVCLVDVPPSARFRSIVRRRQKVIDKEWVIHDLMRYSQGKVDENLIRQWAYTTMLAPL
jgi:hypothetical protein